jgi:hypothetical protein
MIFWVTAHNDKCFVEKIEKCDNMIEKPLSKERFP